MLCSTREKAWGAQQGHLAEMTRARQRQSFPRIHTLCFCKTSRVIIHSLEVLACVRDAVKSDIHYVCVLVWLFLDDCVSMYARVYARDFVCFLFHRPFH